MPTETPQQALDRRLAQGEISLEEYERLKAALKASAAESGNSGRVARPPLTVSWSKLVRKRHFPLIAALVLALAHYGAMNWMWDNYRTEYFLFVYKKAPSETNKVNSETPYTRMKSPDRPKPTLFLAFGFPIVYLSMAKSGGFSSRALLAQSALWGLIGFVVIRRLRRKVVNHDT